MLKSLGDSLRLICKGGGYSDMMLLGSKIIVLTQDKFKTSLGNTDKKCSGLWQTGVSVSAFLHPLSDRLYNLTDKKNLQRKWCVESFIPRNNQWNPQSC